MNKQYCFLLLFVLGCLPATWAQNDLRLNWATILNHEQSSPVYFARGNSVAHDALGNTYVTGTFSGTVDFDPSAGVANLISAGESDIFLAKYNSSGNYLYAKNIGGVSSDEGYSLAFDGSGNICLTGYFQGTVDFDPSVGVANLTSAGGYDVFFAKYNTSGNYLYAKSIGGTSDDYSTALAVDGNNNILVTGYFSGTSDLDPSGAVANLTSAGYTDIFLAKYDASGNYIYAKRIGDTSDDHSVSLGIDSSNNVYITGQFAGVVDFDPSVGVTNLNSGGSFDIFLAKYDTSGNYVYAKVLGGVDVDAGSGLAVDGSGNTYVTGWFRGTADFDPSAGVANLVSAGGQDAFFAKYDALGNYVYAKGFGGIRNETITGLVIDSSGNSYVTGVFQSTTDFDPSAGVANLTNLGLYDVFLAKYDASGNYMYAKSIAGPTKGIGYSVAIDGSGIVYITGQLFGTADFDPSEGVYNLSTINQSSVFVASYRETVVTAGVNDFVLNNLKLYPNPVTDILNIESAQTIYSVEVYSIMGQRVMVNAVNAMSASIDMSALTGGTYLVKVVADDTVKAIKVIKK